MCVCVCVCERERERERESVCDRGSVCVCVCVCVRERERESVYDVYTFTDPSLDADNMLWVSGRNVAKLTNEVCPKNSFRIFPDFRPCIL